MARRIKILVRLIVLLSFLTSAILCASKRQIFVHIFVSVFVFRVFRTSLFSHLIYEDENEDGNERLARMIEIEIAIERESE